MARLAPGMPSAAWEVSTAALSRASVARWLLQRRAAMRRARFPVASLPGVSEGYVGEAPLHHLLTREEKEVNGEEIIN